MGIVLPSAQARVSDTKTEDLSQFSPAPTATTPISAAPAPTTTRSASPPRTTSPSATAAPSAPFLRTSPPSTANTQQRSPEQTNHDSTQLTAAPTEIHIPTDTISNAATATTQTITNQLSLSAGSTLRRPLAEYESAMASLSSSLSSTLQMWKEVRQTSNTDPAALHLSQQFQSLFAAMSGQVAQIDPSATVNLSQSTPIPISTATGAQAENLEKYSGI